MKQAKPILFAIVALLLISAAAHGATCERKYSSGHYRSNSGGWHHRRK